jgi:hypothetical protein
MTISKIAAPANSAAIRACTVDTTRSSAFMRRPRT